VTVTVSPGKVVGGMTTVSPGSVMAGRVVTSVRVMIEVVPGPVVNRQHTLPVSESGSTSTYQQQS
jgi:hypothetical protein